VAQKIISKMIADRPRRSSVASGVGRGGQRILYGGEPVKALLVAMFVLLAGGAARSEPVDCEAVKSSNEPFQVIRVIRANGGLDADHTAVYRDPSGRNIAISTRADGSSTLKAISYGMLTVQRESPSDQAATVKFTYAGVDPQNFPLDRSVTYTETDVSGSGQTVAFRVEYTFVGKKTVALETCQFDVVQFTSRRTRLADGLEVSFDEGEYSPQLKFTLNSKTRVHVAGKELSLVVASRKLFVGTRNFDPPGKAASQPSPSQMPSPPAAASAEFSVSSLWEYLQSPMSPGRIFAHGQAAIAGKSGGWLGGVGFYCAVPHPYLDIFVHKPGGAIADYYWGTATLKSTLALDGVRMPATVERGIIYIDVSDEIRPNLERAFELKPGSPARHLKVEVADFANFELIVAEAAPPPARPATEVVSFAHMMSLCDATVAAQRH
jgi:hypothetical protein